MTQDRAEHEDCEFCAGSDAAADGLPADANPYPPPTLPSDDDRYYDDPHVLWGLGWSTHFARGRVGELPRGDRS